MTTNKPKTQELLPDAEFEKKWDAEGQYTFIRKSNDPRFGEISLYKSKSSNDMIFAKEKLVTAKQQASNDIRDLKSRIALNHPNIQKLLGYSTATQKELCSTNYLTKAYYEFPKSDLHKSFEEKRQNGQVHSASELQAVANQSLQGLNHLHNLDIVHGDIRPLTIGLSKDNQVQILDRLNNPAPVEQVQNKNIVEKKDLFICPELYRKLQGKDKNAKVDLQKNDLYALGLSLLQSGTGDKVQNIYKPDGEVDQNALNNHLEKFDKQHAAQNPHLSKFVHNVLSPNQDERLTSKEYIDKASRLGTQEYKADPFSFLQTKVHSTPPEESTTTTTTTTTIYNNEPDVSYHSFIKKEEPKTAVHSVAPETTTVTYVDEAPTNYIYHQPQTVVHSAPVTYVSPSTTVYSSNQVISQTPKRSITYTSAPVTYTNVPTTTYTQSPVITYTNPVTTYTQPSNITYTQPSVVTYANPPATTYETYTKPAENWTTSTIQAESSSEEHTITVQRADGTAFAFKPKGDSTNLSLAELDSHDPRNGGDGYEANRIQNTQNVFYEKPVDLGTPVTYVKQAKSSYSANQNTVYQTQYEVLDRQNSVFVNNPISSNYTYSTTPGTTVTVQNSGPANVNYYQSHTVHSALPVNEGYSQVRYVQDNQEYQPQVLTQTFGSQPVEVRRSYSTPQNAQTTVVQTKYVIDGDKIIEIKD